LYQIGLGRLIHGVLDGVDDLVDGEPERSGVLSVKEPEVPVSYRRAAPDSGSWLR